MQTKTSTHVFDVQAEVGLTKHMGGVESTRELAALCRIGADSHVLDVGCGAGQTPAWLASAIGCRVTGVDIHPVMVQRSRERAAELGVADRVTIQQADAQDLPFEDNTFDAVLTESVTVFPADKARAVAEYVRVCKPGGYVGLCETTWLKEDPPQELLDYFNSDMAYNGETTTSEGWQTLLREAGLRDVSGKTYAIEKLKAVTTVFKRYGMRHIFRVWGRSFRLLRRDPGYRAFLKTAKSIPPAIWEYLGYGLYVGRKA